jgi:hypothetical protein
MNAGMDIFVRFTACYDSPVVRITVHATHACAGHAPVRRRASARADALFVWRRRCRWQKGRRWSLPCGALPLARISRPTAAPPRTDLSATAHCWLRVVRCMMRVALCPLQVVPCILSAAHFLPQIVAFSVCVCVCVSVSVCDSFSSLEGRRYSQLPRSKNGRRSRCAARLRPFLAPSAVRREPSALGLVSTLEAFVARRTRPCCANPSPYVKCPSGDFDFACRRSSVPVRLPRLCTRSEARTLPCHIAESHNFSPPPSPAIAVSATLRSLARLVDARAGSEMATTPSPLGVLFAVNVFPKRKRGRPSGPVLFCFRLPVGVLGYPLRVHPRTPAPPCAAMAAPRCTMRRSSAIAESSDRSPHPAPT